MGGSKKQTIGYKYFFSIHMGLGRGPANEIAEIRVGDVTAHDTPIVIGASGQAVRIAKPELFGGEKKEGGIDGALYVYNGARTQNLQPQMTVGGKKLPAIASLLGGDVPSFRGVVTVWYDGMVCAMNPYPKEWSFRVRRWDAGWWNNAPWYAGKALILLNGSRGQIKAMNPAHLLYEVNTNPEWGRGMPPELIDDVAWRKAADTLYNEGLGLCIPWFRQENIKEFIPVVINHIGAAQYVDRETGKLTLKLIRGDYEFNDLPLYTPSTGLLDVMDDDSSGEETAYNEIIVKGFDPTSKEDISVRVQNLASIQSQGEIISNTIEYRGLPTGDLVARAAQRELKVQLPLRKMTVILDRRGWRIAPGSVFRISHPKKGIGTLVLRAGEVQDGTLIDGKITIKAVQDIFGMPATSFVNPPSSGWTRPSFVAVPPPEAELVEMNWRDYVRRTDAADQQAVDAGTSYIAMLAKAPSGVQTQGYDIATRTGGDAYTVYVNGGFTAWLTLVGDITPLATSLTVGEENRALFAAEFVEGMVVQIDDEQMQMVSINSVTGIATVVRGVADTIPAAHSATATIWLVDDEMVSDGQEYQDGEEVDAKALTRTTTDLLLLDEADEESIIVRQRVFRPYPPGNVKVGGISVYNPLGEQAEPVLTWAHRDRLMQADVPLGHTAASVGPEPGTTYVVRVYAANGTTLLREDDVGNVATWTYNAALQGEDGNPSTVYIELESSRDGLASLFSYRFFVVITGGWGYGWGENWGGL